MKEVSFMKEEIIRRILSDRIVKETNRHFILNSTVKAKPKLYVEKSTGLAYDFIAGRGYNFKQLLIALKNNDTTIEEHKKKHKNITVDISKVKDLYDCGIVKSYVLSRITEKDVAKYQIRSLCFYGIHSVFIPICKDNYQLRIIDIEDSVTKYYSSPGFNVKSIVYNLSEQGDFVIVNEGVFGAISTDGVAVFNNTLSNEQAKLLNEAKNICFFIDNDTAGKEGFLRSIRLLKSKRLYYYISNKYKDANDMYIAYNFNKELLLEEIKSSCKEVTLENLIREFNVDKNYIASLYSL